MAKKLLNIDLKFQPGSMLCWASCILMILDKFNSTNPVNYVDLINKLRIINGATSGLDQNSIDDLNEKLLQCSLDSFFDSMDNVITSSWNRPIENMNSGNFKKYFECIFSDLHIFSNEDYQICYPILDSSTAWDLIKKQINSKTPLILILSSSGLWHAVVIVGYWQKTINRKKENFIFVHDPISNTPCNGESYSYNINTLWDPDATLKPEGLIFDFKSKNNLSIRGGITIKDSSLFSPKPSNIHNDLTIESILT